MKLDIRPIFATCKKLSVLRINKKAMLVMRPDIIIIIIVVVIIIIIVIIIIHAFS